MKAFVDLFHPRILVLLVVIPLVSFGFWAFMAYLSWDILKHALDSLLSMSPDFHEYLNSILVRLHFSPENFYTSVLAILLGIILLPAVILTAFSLLSGFALPWIVRYLRQNEFNLLQSISPVGGLRSVVVLVNASIIFLLVWMMTVPLWFMIPLGPIASFSLAAWFHSWALPYESLCDVASDQEIRQVRDKNKVYFFLAGGFVAFLWFIPGAFLIAPLYGGLLMGRLSLKALALSRET